MVLLCLHRYMCVLQMFIDYLILARIGSKIMVSDTDTSSVHLFNHIWLFATHRLQHAKFLSPSSSPGACSKSCLLIRWCHPTISSCVIPFSFCLQYFPASGSFQWLNTLHQMAKVLELQLQLQYQFFQWIFRTDFL